MLYAIFMIAENEYLFPIKFVHCMRRFIHKNPTLRTTSTKFLLRIKFLSKLYLYNLMNMCDEVQRKLNRQSGC
jgi:hypothetical protein